MITSLVFLAFVAVACTDTGTEPRDIPERVKLTLIDVAVRETYLHIAVAGPTMEESLFVHRDGRTVLRLPAVEDTSIADTGLVQTTTYAYSAFLVATTETTGTSNIISARTLAPTSHNFTWQTFLLGDGNGSALYDVALINDSLAFACGEIYLGGDPTRYNAAIWDGGAWNIVRIPYYYQGQPFYNPIQAVFALSKDDVWFAGNGVIHWDGHQYIPIDISAVWGPYRINRIWGNVGDIWIVGEGGAMAHRDASGTWQRLESGTTTQINDAWGVVNPVTGREEVYCSAGDRVLRIRSTDNIDSVWRTTRTRDGIWTHSGFPIFTAGDGVFENSAGRWQEANIGAGIYTNAIRGNALNDLFAVGDFGLLAHFNGMTWNPLVQNPGGDYYNLAMRDRLVVAVGEMNARGLIIIGRRN